MAFHLPDELGLLALRHSQLAGHALTRAGLEAVLTAPAEFDGHLRAEPGGAVLVPERGKSARSWCPRGVLDLGPVRRGETQLDADEVFLDGTATAVEVGDVLRAKPATMTRTHEVVTALDASVRQVLAARGSMKVTPRFLADAERERPVLRLAERVLVNMDGVDRVELVWLDEADAVLVCDTQARRQGWKMWTPVGGPGHPMDSRKEILEAISTLRIEVLRLYDGVTLAREYHRMARIDATPAEHEHHP